MDYHCAHIHAMSEAIANGVDLIAYTTWGCIDIVSAGTGEIRKRDSISMVIWTTLEGDTEGFSIGIKK